MEGSGREGLEGGAGMCITVRSGSSCLDVAGLFLRGD